MFSEMHLILVVIGIQLIEIAGAVVGFFILRNNVKPVKDFVDAQVPALTSVDKIFAQITDPIKAAIKAAITKPPTAGPTGA